MAGYNQTMEGWKRGWVLLFVVGVFAARSQSRPAADGRSGTDGPEFAMAKLTDLPLWDQAFLKLYRYRQARWSKPAGAKPLREARVALVSTAGLHLPSQKPFDEARKGGDPSYRWLPNDLAVQDLEIAHRSQAFSREGIQLDRNLCFPLDRLRELVREGIVGGLSHRHLSWMGSITAPGRLLSQTAPEAAAGLQQDGVDVALLIPV